MSTIFGALGLNDSERVFQATTGQVVIYDAIAEYVNRINMEVMSQISLFVDSMTENYKERFKLPGGGRMQDMGFDPQAKPAGIKATGGWDVAYPISNYMDAIVESRVAAAYMSVADLDRHVKSITIRNAATVRHNLLRALFKNTTTTFVDPHWGSLTVQPLASGDGTLYPPVIGSETEAEDTHHLESGYLAATISDTNNPYVTIEAELVEHFGKSQGNDNVVVFINSAQVAKTEDLSDFIELPDTYVIPGLQTATLTGLPAMMPSSSRIIGRTNGCWVSQWDWIPANYMLGIHLDVDKPLKMRVDPGDTGLERGLQLIAEDEEFPFKSAYWSHRYGFGVANRLNAVVMELGEGGTYTIPTGYS